MRDVSEAAQALSLSRETEIFLSTFVAVTRPGSPHGPALPSPDGPFKFWENEEADGRCARAAFVRTSRERERGRARADGRAGRGVAARRPASGRVTLFDELPQAASLIHDT